MRKDFYLSIIKIYVLQKKILENKSSWTSLRFHFFRPCWYEEHLWINFDEMFGSLNYYLKSLNFIKSCEISCKKKKKKEKKKKNKIPRIRHKTFWTTLTPLSTPKRPWPDRSMKFIRKLLKSKIFFFFFFYLHYGQWLIV